MVTYYDNRGCGITRGGMVVVYAEGVTACEYSTTKVVHITMVLVVVFRWVLARPKDAHPGIV